MYLTPYIDIKPNFPGHDFPGDVKKTIGELKYKLDISHILDKMHINEKFVEFVKESNYSFIPLSKDYYYIIYHNNKYIDIQIWVEPRLPIQLGGRCLMSPR
jgi:hypothetical protein